MSEWEHHSYYREIEILIWMPEETHYTAYINDVWQMAAYIGIIKDKIDEFLGVEPEPEPDPEPEPEPGNEYHSTYRGVVIEVWMPDGHPFRAFYDDKWDVNFDLQDIKNGIDAWLEPEPDPEPDPEEDTYIETYRDYEIWRRPDEGLYYSNMTTQYTAIGLTIVEVRQSIDDIIDVIEPPPVGTWPWPLDGVQEWFDELLNNVVAAPLSALTGFWTAFIEPKMVWIEKQLSASILWTYNQIKPIINNISVAINDVWTGLSTQITNMRTGLSNTISLYSDWLWDSIEPAFTVVREKLIEIRNSISTNVQNGLNSLHTSISTNLANVRIWIGNTVTATANWLYQKSLETANTIRLDNKTNLDKWVTNTQTWVSDVILGGMDWVTQAMSGVAGAMGDALSGFFDGVLKSIGNTAEMIFGAVNFVIAKLSDGIIWLMSDFLNVLTNAMSPGSPPAPIQVAAKVLSETTWTRQMDMIDSAYTSDPTLEGLQTSAINMQTVLLAAATAAIGTGLAADLAHPIKGMGFRPTIREMVYWSGIPSVTAAIAITPAAIGLLEPLKYALNKKWMPHVPPANDLVRFALREVWDASRWEALIAFYPGEQYSSLMAMHGYKSEFAEYYWMAHWVLPSVGQLSEMLYRGIITSDVWEDFVRYNDYIPEMIGNLQQIIYKPYTRVDSRRMWDLGVLTDDQVYENFLWLGYDDEHAQTMTLWTKAYVIAQDIRALYSKGWIDEAGAKLMIIEAGIPATRADVFLKRLVQVEQPERMANERDLTKTDILRMLKSRILTEPQTIDMLIGLGYDANEAFYLVQLYMYADEIDLRELTMSQILKAYRYEIYDRDKAKLELEDAGWTTEAAETLLVLEDVKLADAQVERARERDLSRTDIVNSVKSEILDKETGTAYLAYLGYSDWEINIIYALAGIE